MKKTIKFGFTLAEVLITLGIIGVIAAITIPALISTYRKKQLEAQIKTTYTTIQQTLRFAEDEDISYNSVLANDDVSLINFYNNFLAKHLKVEQVTINKRPNVDKEVHVIYYPSGDKYGDIGVKNIGLTIAKGAIIYISVATNAELAKKRYGIDFNEKPLIFFFDANGKSKPNVMGNDVQLAAWTEKGLVPGGYSLTPEEIDVSCFNQQGHACLNKIIKDNWKIPDKVWKRKIHYRE